MSSATIQLKLFASLTVFSPENNDRLPILPGTSVKRILEQISVPIEKVHLIFVDGIRQSLDTRLKGGERVGIFPAVAGG